MPALVVGGSERVDLARQRRQSRSRSRRSGRGSDCCHHELVLVLLHLEHLSARTDRAFDLPERAAAVVAECVEGADGCERGEFVAMDPRGRDQLLDRRICSRSSGPG